MRRPGCTCTEFPCNCPVIEIPTHAEREMFRSIMNSDSRYGPVVPRVHIVKAGEHTYKISDGKEYILRGLLGSPYWQEIKTEGGSQ